MFSMDRQWFTALLLRVFQHVDAAPVQTVPFINATNISIQQHEPTWQSGPGSRGTLSLVLSCAITLFFCIWTAVHVNIEPTNEINYTLDRLFGSFLPCLKDIKLGKFLAKSWVRKLGWGCVALLVPEGVMAIATYERSSARLLRDKINDVKRKSKDKDEWDMSLAYYSVMGGFTISERVYDAQGGSEPGGKNKPLTLTPFGVLQVAKWECSIGDGAGSAGGRKRMLLAVTSEEVRDKGNANWFAKAIVFWQVFWMMIEVSGRAAAKLPVTLLELHTVLHTFCAAAMYVAWWYKPVDIGTPTILSLDNDLVKQLREGTKDRDPTDPLTMEQTEADKVDKRAYLTSRAGLGKKLFYSLCGNEDLSYFARLANAYARLQRGWGNIWKQCLIISIVGLVYGGVHLTSWNSVFPSDIEELLWQIAAAITAAASSLFALSLWLNIGASEFYALIFAMSTVPCILARLYLLVESFASLRQLPLGAYKIPRWANLWPHAS